MYPGCDVPIPDDFPIPRCERCGETIYDPETTLRLDRVLFEIWVRDRDPRIAALWDRVKADPRLPAPYLNREGNALTWSRDHILVEVEFGGDGFEWYGRDRLTGRDAGSDHPVTEDPELLRWIERIPS